MSAVLFLAILLAAYGCGASLLRLFRCEDDLRRAAGGGFLVVVRGTLGAGALSLGALAILSAQHGPPVVFRALTVPMAAWGAWCVARTRADFRLPPGFLRDPVDALGAAAFASASALYLWLAWNPVILFDSWAYHVTMPKQYLIHGRVFGTPYGLTSNFHYFWQFLYCWGLAWAPKDFILPKLPQVAALVATGFVAATLLRRSGLKGAGWTAGTLILLTRENIEVAPDPHVDAGTAFLVVMTAAVGFFHWRVPTRSRLGVLLLCGAMAGFANGSKNNAIAFTGLIGLAGAIAMAARAVRLKRARPRAARRAFVPVLVGGAAFLLPWFLLDVPWLLKNAAITGSPTYPFFPAVFPAGPEYAQAAADFLDSYAPARISPPWTFDFWRALPGRFEFVFDTVPYCDQHRQIALMLVAGLLALLRRERDDSWRFFLACGVLLFPAAFMSPARRFTLGPAAIFTVAGVREIALLLRARLAGAPRLARWGPVALAAMALAAQFSDAKTVFGLRHHVARPSVDRRLYPTQEAMDRQYYALRPDREMIATIDREVGPNGRLFTTEVLFQNAMIQVPALIALDIHGKGALRIMAENEGNDAERIVERLRGWGATHVFTADTLDESPELARLRDRWLDFVAASGEGDLYALRTEPRDGPPPARTDRRAPHASPQENAER